MIDLNINPHKVAKEVLETCRAKGERFAHDESIVVLADLFRSERDE